jgi:hypothetical protein
MKKSYPDGEGPITLWGHAQEVEEIAEGVLSVSTACHGGILVSQDIAMKKLSKQARVIGVLFNSYYSNTVVRKPRLGRKV